MTVRRERNRDRRLAATFAASYRCPDCNATTALNEAAPGLLVLEVQHDETCPEHKRIQNHGSES